MAGYQSYPEYKDSGVEWLGEVPKHWDVSKTKLHFDIQLGKMLQPEPRGIDDEEVTYLKAGHVQWENIDLHELPTMWASPNEREKFRVVNGDLLVCEGGEVGRSALLVGLEQECIIQNALHRVRPLDHTCTKYLNYLMRHLADADWFSILCNKATIAHLTGDKLGALVFPMPQLDEQQTIARFLDHKTAQIDALIAKKEALLEKLAEKRTALISHAVTKGLNPQAKMKDSGVEWLGHIPAYWTPIRLRHCSEFVTSGSRGWAEYFADEGDPFLRITNVTRDTISLLQTDIQRVIPPVGAEGARTATAPGDVVVSITADLGSVAVIPDEFEPAFVSQHLALVRPQKSKIIAQWLAFQIFSTIGKTQLLGAGYGGTKIQLSLSDIKDLWIALPPVKEQQEIVFYLDSVLGKLLQQSDKIQSAIHALTEYRSALITQAVTGKIDVRYWQVALRDPAGRVSVA